MTENMAQDDTADSECKLVSPEQIAVSEITTLDGKLQIQNIQDVKAKLAQALGSVDECVGDSIAIDASGVESVDIAALQLLAAFSNELNCQSKTIQWHGISDSMSSAIGLCGLSELLGIRTGVGSNSAGNAKANEQG